MYNVGDIIIYGEHGICRVTACGALRLGGQNRRMYYTLHPYYRPELVIYAPTDSDRVVIRDPLTRQQAEQLVEELPEIPPLDIPDEKSRELLFNRVQHDCDCRSLASMIKALYLRREQRQQHGKRATSVDERYFRAAEEQFSGELAFALGMEKEQTSAYIESLLMQCQ